MTKVDSLLWGDFKRILELELPLHRAGPEAHYIASKGAFALANGFILFFLNKAGMQRAFIPDGTNEWETFGNIEDVLDSWNKILELLVEFSTNIGDRLYFHPPMREDLYMNENKKLVLDLLFKPEPYFDTSLLLQEHAQIDFNLVKDLRWELILKEEEGKTLRDIREQNASIILSNIDIHLRGDEGRPLERLLVYRPDSLIRYLMMLDHVYSVYDTLPLELVMEENHFDEQQPGVINFDLYAESNQVYCNDDNFVGLIQKYDKLSPLLQSRVLNFSDFAGTLPLEQGSSEWEKIRDEYIKKLEEWILGTEPRPEPKYKLDAQAELDDANKLIEINAPAAILSATRAMEFLLKGMMNIPVDTPVGLGELVRMQVDLSILPNFPREPRIRPYYHALMHLAGLRNNKAAHTYKQRATVDEARHAVHTAELVFEGLTKPKRHT